MAGSIHAYSSDASWAKESRTNARVHNITASPVIDNYVRQKKDTAVLLKI